MAYLLKAPQAYGFSQPLIAITPQAQKIAGVPNPTRSGVLGQLQVDSLTGAVYMLTGVVAGLSVWTALGGGAGTFATLTVAGAAAIGGALAVTGNETVGGSLTVTGNITSTTGDISAAAGFLSGNTGVFSGLNLYTAGDDGTGTVGTTSFTDTTDDTQGAGALTLLSTNGVDGTNAGFIGGYVGTTRVWIPYFTDIAP